MGNGGASSLLVCGKEGNARWGRLLLALVTLVTAALVALSAVSHYFPDYTPSLPAITVSIPAVGQEKPGVNEAAAPAAAVEVTALRGTDAPQRQGDAEGSEPRISVETPSPSGATLAPTSPKVPNTQAPTNFKVPKEQRCVGSVFKYSIDVWLDDECYPPVFQYNVPPVFGRDSVGRVVLEPIKTQRWNYEPNYGHSDHIRGAPAVLKMFEDTLVYRVTSEETTYFRNDRIWSMSQRCQTYTTPAVSWQGNSDSLPIIEEAVLISSQIWGYGHYHYMTENGLAIGPARDVLQRKEVKIIIEEQRTRLFELYQILGIDRSRIIIQKGGQALRVKKLYLPYYALCGIIHPGLVKLTSQWIRDSQPHLYSKRQALARDILVIDRRRNLRCPRCLRNTDELLAELRKSFPDRTVIHFNSDSYSQYDQMKMFSSAELVVAPHGAGLVNMMFAPPHAKVVEIYNNPAGFNHCYYDLALDLGFRYRLIGPLRTSESAVDFERADIQRTMDAIHAIMKSD